MQESGPLRISIVNLTTMKRFFLILSLLLCVQVTFAQRDRRDWKPQTEISLSYSAYPRMAAEEFRDGHYGEIFGGSFDSQRAQVDQIHSIGLITGEVAFKLKKWFTVGVQVAGTSFWADAVSTGTRISGTAVYLLPNVRFTYIRSDIFNMYSGIGAGLVMQSGFSERKSDFAGLGGVDMNGAIQVVPVGFHLGRDLYALGEVSLGTVNLGFRVGLGYRF